MGLENLPRSEIQCKIPALLKPYNTGKSPQFPRLNSRALLPRNAFQNPGLCVLCEHSAAFPECTHSSPGRG